MADRRAPGRLLGGGLSGEEVARLALRGWADEQAGRAPAFSDAEVARARATLRGRPGEAAVYDAWVEATRIVEYVGMDAIAKALEAERVLAVLVLSLAQLLRLGTLRHAARAATKVLTPEEWETFPARREAARRARMAEERVTLGAVVRRRAWWAAPEGLKARAGAPPSFDEEGEEDDDVDDDRDGYARLLEADGAAALRLRAAAEAEVAGLVRAGRLRFVRGGTDVSARIGAGWREGVADEEAEAFEEEAGCSLLGLAEAGLPEWAGHAGAAWLTPAEYRGPVAVLREVPPDRLDGAGRFADPGWKWVQDVIRREGRSERLEQLRSTAAVAEVLLRVFLARVAVVEALGEGIGLDLVPPPLRRREAALRELLADYGRLAAMGREGEPDEDGYVPPEWLLPLPRDLNLPPLDLDGLGPDPGEVGCMREALAVPDAEGWWEAALGLGVLGALGEADAELWEQLRRRGRELGSINLALEELVA